MQSYPVLNVRTKYFKLKTNSACIRKSLNHLNDGRIITELIAIYKIICHKQIRKGEKGESTRMRTEMTSLIFICFWLIVEGSTVATTVSPAPIDDRCSNAAFKNCTDMFEYLTNTTSGSFNAEVLLDFYCSPNYTTTIECIRNNLDPTCGPDTDAYVWNSSLSVIPANYSLDSYCKNYIIKKDLEKLLQCQTMFSDVIGFVNCITGKTLNKTVTPTDACGFLQTSLGCSFKYTKLMCPGSTKTFIDNSGDNLKFCNLEMESIEEVSVCDEGIEKACFVAYKPPPVTSNSSEFTEFICSERSRGLQTCLRTVYTMCKNNTNFNSSSVDRDLQNYEAQTDIFCSEKSNAMKECQAKFSKLNAFQDCITGKTLNTTINTSDMCLFLQNSVACTYKYTDLLCPENLDLFNKSTSFPSICKQSSEINKAVTSCDKAIYQACSAGFNPPVSRDPDVYYEFICSGRATRYISCVKKVQSLCENDTSLIIELTPSNQFSTIQTDIICSDKKGFTDYIKCLRKPNFQNEYANCSAAKVDSNMTESCSQYECQLKSLEITCSQSAKFCQKLNYQNLLACKVIDATTKGTITSTGSFLKSTIPAFVAIAWNTFTRVLI